VVNRIVDDVVERRLVLLLALDHLRPEPAPEDVVAAPVSSVEGTCVLAVEVAHAVGEVRPWRLDDEVVVVSHQAMCVRAPAVAPRDASEEAHEDPAVAVVDDDRGAVVPACAHVVVRAGFEVAMGTAHVSTVAAVRRAR
jgi:hypothetical protein